MVRVRIRDGVLEDVFNLRDFPQVTDMFAGWIGLTPDDAPLLMRDRSLQEIYALDLHFPWRYIKTVPSCHNRKAEFEEANGVVRAPGPFCSGVLILNGNENTTCVGFLYGEQQVGGKYGAAA